MSDNVKSEKFQVSVPRGIAVQIRELAKNLCTSDSKAALMLIVKGLEAVQGEKNPLNRKPE